MKKLESVKTQINRGRMNLNVFVKNSFLGYVIGQINGDMLWTILRDFRYRKEFYEDA